MLASQHRVTSGTDYRRIVREGTRVRCSGLTLHVLATSSTNPARFGFVITKMIGKAHDRNTLRRRLKAIGARLIQDGLTGVDVIVRPQPAALLMPFSAVLATIVKPMAERGFLSEVTHS